MDSGRDWLIFGCGILAAVVILTARQCTITVDISPRLHDALTQPLRFDDDEDDKDEDDVPLAPKEF